MLDISYIQYTNLEKIPAAQKGHNTGSIAICLSGLNDFTKLQFESLRELCQAIDFVYISLDINGYKIQNVSFHGHCEVSNKTCPVFDYRGILGLDEDGKMSKGLRKKGMEEFRIYKK